MKLTIVFFLTASVALSFADDPATGLPQGLDIGSTVLAAFSEVTKQVNAMQSVLSQLNVQLNRMISTSTRLIAGPELRYSDSGLNPGGLAGSMFETFNRMTGQLSSVQTTMQQLSQQLQRVLESSTRMLTGPSLYQTPDQENNNFVESVLRTLESWAKQLQQMNAVLRTMNGQWNRVIETGTRIITGTQQPAAAQYSPQADSGSGNSIASGLPGLSLPSGLPGIEQLQQFFGLVGQQLVSLQRILIDFSGQLTRMVSNRGISPMHQQPDPSQQQETGQSQGQGLTSPADSLLNILNLLTNQFSQVQRVLSDLNGQMNRMLETGTRALG